ncbi:actinorhodin polyketide synthase acyl carrier protein [Frankia sp. R43]|uniref:acyl carrier protein n=1 Tax=Frankia sp. R43 TaxID=269536 RepID=UPI0006CA2756|nr:acyl carrier protein [Frankia sp. R43]KPM56072.1 actinorhodin polyketide synthase acyl carrier protein [Frankia sp. R43]
MAAMTLDELCHLLVAVAGEPIAEVASTDLADTEFTELGYDSLALMEAAARIAQEYGVRIPDADIFEMQTPRDLLDLVNGAPGAGDLPAPVAARP